MLNAGSEQHDWITQELERTDRCGAHARLLTPWVALSRAQPCRGPASECTAGV